MKHATRSAGIVLALATLLAGCGGDEKVDCGALSSEAGYLLDDAIEASRGPCTEDADCVGMAHSSNCHDWCGGTVLMSKLDAVDSVRDALNADQCSQFKSAECVLIIPPCVAPGAPACVEGVCSEQY